MAALEVIGFPIEAQLAHPWFGFIPRLLQCGIRRPAGYLSPARTMA